MNVFKLVGEMTIKGVDKVETTVQSVSSKSKSSFAEMGSAAGKAASDMESGAGKARGSVSKIGSSADGAAADVSSAMAKVSSAVKGIVSSAQSAASGFAAGMDKIGGAAKTAAKGVGVVTGASAAVGAGLMAFSSASEETIENMGKLETAAGAVGVIQDKANETYKRFFGLVGDSDQATEATQDMLNLAQAGGDIDTWYDIASGTMARFGDALQVENLIESANETIRCGQVVGGMADAVNWATISNEQWNAVLGDHPAAMQAFSSAVADGASAEDAFNAALAKCTDESERAEITQALLASAFQETGKAYQETNAKLIESRQAQADWNAALAEAGEAVMPFTTAITQIGTSILNDAMPYIEQFSGWMQEKLPLAKDAASGALGFIKDNVLPPLSSAFAYLKDEILPPIVQTFERFRDEVLPPLSEAFMAAKDALAPLIAEGFQWFADNLPIIVPLMAGLVGAFVAYQAALGISALIQAVSTAMDIMRNSSTLAAGAQALLNAVMNANPIVLVVTLLAGLVTALITAYNTNEDFRAIVDNAWNTVKSAVGTAIDNIKGFLQNLKDGLQGAWDKVVGFKDTVVQAFDNIRNGIGDAINTARDTVGNAIDAIKGFFNFNISWPHIPMPEFTISPPGWQIGDLLKGSIPWLDIAWHAKAMDNGMIMNGPTIFGYDAASRRLLAGGEAGSETVVGTESLMAMIRGAVLSAGGDSAASQTLTAILKEISALRAGLGATIAENAPVVVESEREARRRYKRAMGV